MEPNGGSTKWAPDAEPLPGAMHAAGRRGVPTGGRQEEWPAEDKVHRQQCFLCTVKSIATLPIDQDDPLSG